nr:MAG TPA: hypothetical protein [Caudoviricetes sp.]
MTSKNVNDYSMAMALTLNNQPHIKANKSIDF